MKYTLEIAIQKPLEEVAKTFEDNEKFKHWQKGFIGKKQISGTPGEEGAKAEVTYKIGNKTTVLIETIVKKNLPHELHTTYENKGVYNIHENHFEYLDDNATKWIAISEFKFTSFSSKLYSFLVPGSFKKQSYKYMKDFKAYIEKGISVVA